MKRNVLPIVAVLLAPPTMLHAGGVLQHADFKSCIERFNADDRESFAQAFPNAKAWEFLSANIPLFECPDTDLQQTFYFRWWTFRKHLKQTPDGWVITEFLPAVPWAGKYNTINCAAGHHIREGRWLADQKFVRDYFEWWLHKGGRARAYSFWLADSVLAWCDVTGDFAPAKEWLPDLIKNYGIWEKEKSDAATGLFWQNDNADGMEGSISGSGFRPTINSYQFGDALGIARIAEMAGETEVAQTYRAKAEKLKQLVQSQLWNSEQEFFEVRRAPRPQPGAAKTGLVTNDVTQNTAALSNARELLGYVPWYFNLPDSRFGTAWKQLADTNGFAAPFGLTTAERRHPGFAIQYDRHECLWNGPVWPFATAQTLTALANYLNREPQPVLTREDYFDALRTYARSHRLKLDDGKTVPWIDEDQNPFTGDWIARTCILNWEKKDLKKWQGKGGTSDRGKDYNHSTFCDLVINGLVGLRPRADDTVEVNPLVPADAWDWFCLDRVPYHGHTLTILWDKTGKRYGRGAGLCLLADGKVISKSEALSRLTGKLPQ